MSRPKGDHCPQWCDWWQTEHDGHSGPHVSRVGEVLLSHTEPAFVVTVTVESKNHSPEPCLTLGGRYTSYASAVMTWDESDRVTSLLTDARHRYG